MEYNDIIFNKIDDLMWYEGPLLSHFKDQYNNQYIFQIRFIDTQYCTWLVFKITNSGFREFFNKQKSLRDLALENDHVFIVETNAYSEHIIIKKHMTKNISEKLLPPDTAMYNESSFEPYAISLHSHLS